MTSDMQLFCMQRVAPTAGIMMEPDQQSLWMAFPVVPVHHAEGFAYSQIEESKRFAPPTLALQCCFAVAGFGSLLCAMVLEVQPSVWLCVMTYVVVGRCVGFSPSHFGCLHRRSVQL